MFASILKQWLQKPNYSENEPYGLKKFMKLCHQNISRKQKKPIFIVFLPLLLLACNKTESDVHREFPIAQNQIDEFIVQENTYWNFASVAYQDESRQIIHLTHDQRASCNINLNTLDKKHVSCMGIGFWFKSGEMTEDEILQYKQAQKQISEMIRLFYTSDKKNKVLSE